MRTETNKPQPLPVLQDVGVVKPKPRIRRYTGYTEAQKRANERYKMRQRVAVIAPRPGLDVPTTFSSITAFKRYAVKIVNAWYPYEDIDTDELLAVIDKLYEEYKAGKAGKAA